MAKDDKKLAPKLDIAPEALVPRREESRLQQFFLSLAAVFNDFKGLLLLESTWGERFSANEAAAEELGEYNGVLVQLRKLQCGVLHELMGLLIEFQDLLEEPEVQRLLKRKPKHVKRQWRELIAIARGSVDGGSAREFTKALVKIRNNVAFHYTQPKPLVAGFRKHFFELPASEQNEAAYASLGASMEQTRFYYADAAVQQALRILSSELGERFDDEFRIGIRRILDAIGNLLDAYNSKAFASA